jgi:hypothetical protein
MSIVQNENRLKGIPDEALKQMYVRAAMDPLKVGTPEFLLLAGEMQARKDLRQKAAMGQGDKTPVIQDLLAEAAVPPQPMMPQAPAEGGIAAMRAPSAEQEFATGGMVAFENGGSPMDRVLEQMFGEGRRPMPYAPVPRQQLSEEELAEAARLKGLGVFGATKEALIDPVVNFFTQGTPLRERAQTTSGPADVGFVPPAALAAQADQAAQAGVVPLQPAAEDKPTVTRVDQLKQPTAGGGATTPKMDTAGIMGIAQQFAGKTPDEITTTDEAAVKDQFKLYKDMGIDLDPYKKIKERLASADSEYEKQRNEAGLMALAQFGFNWASNTGPTLAAAAKAGRDIMPGVMESVKDLRKLKREDEKLGAEISAFDSRMRKDITDKARAELQAKKNRVEDRRNAVNDNAARISGTIFGQQLASQTTLAATKMTTEATITKLKEQIGETQTKNIVDAATKLVTSNPRYALAQQEQKDTMLNDAIQQVLRARSAAGTTVTKN